MLSLDLAEFADKHFFQFCEVEAAACVARSAFGRRAGADVVLAGFSRVPLLLAILCGRAVGRRAALP